VSHLAGGGRSCSHPATVIRKTLLLCTTLGLMTPVIACDSEDDDGGGGDTNGMGTPGVPAAYAGQENPVDGDSAAIAAGETTYASLCANCHGDGGAGDGPGAGTDPPATDFTSTDQPDDYYLWIVSDGSEGTAMGPYSSQLSEDEIWQVIAYINSL